MSIIFLQVGDGLLGVSHFRHPRYVEWTLNNVVSLHGYHPPHHSKSETRTGWRELFQFRSVQSDKILPFLFISRSMDILPAIFLL